MEEAEYCHRLALMNRGRLIALDTPAGLRSAMREPLLRVETADAAAAVNALRDAPGVLDAAMFGRDVHVIVGTGARAGEAVTGLLHSRGVPVSRVTAVAPSLEDVFVSLVRAGGGAAED
jgi:ABC-2 type transport system ATP-binding protein